MGYFADATPAFLLILATAAVLCALWMLGRSRDAMSLTHIQNVNSSYGKDG
jgi:hypothetical protein